MARVTIGERAFRIHAAERNGSWCAHAISLEHGDRFGADFTASSEDAAVASVERWLEWQSRHAAALAALQEAERAYYRLLADQTFAVPDPSAASLQARQVALDGVEAARVRLDEVRAQQPEPSQRP